VSQPTVEKRRQNKVTAARCEVFKTLSVNRFLLFVPEHPSYSAKRRFRGKGKKTRESYTESQTFMNWKPFRPKKTSAIDLINKKKVKERPGEEVAGAGGQSFDKGFEWLGNSTRVRRHPESY